MRLLRALPFSKLIVSTAAVALTVISLGAISDTKTPTAEAQGAVFPSIGVGCSTTGGASTVILRASAFAFFTNITHVTVNIDGGSPEYDSGAISTTFFAHTVTAPGLAIGAHPFTMTVSSIGNADVTKTGTATISATGCKVVSN